MPLQKNQHQTTYQLIGNAKTLFSEVATYKELNQKSSKTNQKKELQYYLSFRILDSLYKFQNSPKDTNFSDENYSQFFNNPPNRDLINRLRNQILYDKGMNFDQGLLDKLSNNIIKEFKLGSSVDSQIQDTKLSNEQQDVYYESYKVTKEYSKFIAHQVTQFEITPDLTKKEILEELKSKSDEINQKKHDAQNIVNQKNIRVTVDATTIVKALEDLKDLTNSLIHEEPQEGVAAKIFKEIKAVSNRLNSAYVFLSKTPQQIADETIAKVESDLQKTMNKERDKILKQYGEDFHELQAREVRERREIEIEENGSRQETEVVADKNMNKIIKNSQRKNLLEEKISEIESKKNSIKNQKTKLATEVIPNAKKLKEAQKIIENDDNIEQSVQILHSLFEETVEIKTIKSDLLKVINSAMGSAPIKVGIVNYFSSVPILKTKQAREAGSRKTVNDMTDLMIQLLGANENAKTIFECNNKTTSIKQQILLLDDTLEKIKKEQDDLTKQLNELNKKQDKNSKEELNQKTETSNLDQELLKQEKTFQEISNEYYGDETLNFIIKSDKNFTNSNVEYLEASLTKSSDLLNEALKNFKESNNQQIIIPAFINLSDVSPELTSGHYAIICIKKDEKGDKVSFIDPTGLDSLNNGFNNHIWEVLNSYLNGKEEDILISHSQIQFYEKEKDGLIIVDNNHCGAFVCFIASGLLDRSMALNQNGNLTFKDEVIKDLTKEESDSLGNKIREIHLEFVRGGELVNYEEIKNNLKFYDKSESSSRDNPNSLEEQKLQSEKLLIPSNSSSITQIERLAEELLPQKKGNLRS